jgi:hypothetical protein
MNIEKFLKNPKTVEIIINSLNNVVKLPNDGFLAGGSVANMLLSLYHDGTPWRFKVNDVDIFKPTNDTSIESDGEHSLNNGTAVDISLELHDEGYGHTFVEADGTYYKVLSSERFGLINEVKCLVSHGHSGGNQERVIPEPPTDNPDKYMFSVTYNEPKIPNIDPDNDIILRGFDLNCCQAGIDLSNGVLHYTKEFVEFLKSKQVLVIIPYTPFHTAVRMVKKMDMYGSFCYCDLDYEMKYLNEAKYIEDVCQFFGKENYDKFQEYKHILGEYIEIKPLEFRQMPYEYKLKYFPKSMETKALGRVVKMVSSRFDDVDVEVSEERRLWRYEFIKDLGYIDEELDKVWLLKKVWELKYRPMKKSHRNKINNILSYHKTDFTCLYNDGDGRQIPYHVQCLISNDGYYDCDFTDKHLEEIHRFINEHRGLAGVLFKSGNVQEQYNNIKLIKSITKQEGQWIIGVLETLGCDINSQTKITKEWVMGLVEKEKQRMSTPLVDPINLSGFKYKKYVTELTTPLELRVEGEKMGHCVGGYSGDIKRGGSRIFHIEVDGIGSTLQISLKGDNYPGSVNYDKVGCSISQHYGRYPEKVGNQTPTNKNRGIAFKLCYHMSQQSLKEEDLEEILESTMFDRETRVIRENILERERRHLGSGHTVTASKQNPWSKWLKDGHQGKNNGNIKRRRAISFW